MSFSIMRTGTPTEVAKALYNNHAPTSLQNAAEASIAELLNECELPAVTVQASGHSDDAGFGVEISLRGYPADSVHPAPADL